MEMMKTFRITVQNPRALSNGWIYWWELFSRALAPDRASQKVCLNSGHSMEVKSHTLRRATEASDELNFIIQNCNIY